MLRPRGGTEHADRGVEVATTARDGRLNGVKLPVPDGDVADVAVVAARTAEGAGEARCRSTSWTWPAPG